MTAQKVGVDVRLEDPLDAQPVFCGFLEIDVDIPTRIDDDRAAGALVPYQIGSLRQTAQIVLREDHGYSSSLLFPWIR